jgi:hypothetical protein
MKATTNPNEADQGLDPGSQGGELPEGGGQRPADTDEGHQVQGVAGEGGHQAQRNECQKAGDDQVLARAHRRGRGRR